MRKKLTAPNGVPLEYHRVALVTIDVNNRVTVKTHSYIDESARQVEKDYAAGKYNHLGKGEMQFPYVSGKSHHLEYEEGMGVERAYEWLKTLPEFADAADC